jgi:hypothetical protein
VSHDALKRLGVFAVGDRVIYVPDDPFSDEEYAVVIEVDVPMVRIRFEEDVANGDLRSLGLRAGVFSPRTGEDAEKTTTTDQLRHNPVAFSTDH